METFTEVRDFVSQHYSLKLDEPFLLSFDIQLTDSQRRQSLFLAELKADDGRRFLRVETPIAPLDDLDPEKCLRINLMMRVGYLAVGDLDGSPYIKMCANLPYRYLQPDELVYAIEHIAPMADRLEEILEPESDIS